MGEVQNIIITYVNINSKKKNKKGNGDNNTVKGNTECYGVDPETLKRWAEEEKN